ncbi:toll/interleukin-1 receptor domain-containing protein, partial [bacterium]|nr:toll/interleukin-1 receptor domain-containing protein [bacterium]
MKKNDPIKQPRIFISYSSKDVEVVEQIHLHLEKSAGFEVWRDKNRIEQDWSREI